MRDFEYERPSSVGPTTGSGPDETLLAGGTDLLPLMKIDRVAPGKVIDIKRSQLGRQIERTEDGWRIGALANLSDLEDHEQLADELAVVVEAIATTATRQIRNRATVGGNLLQRSRCSYYRDPTLKCWLAGGDHCPARNGRNDLHAVFDTGTCVTTQPSDLANALVALGASVAVTDDHGVRSMLVEDLLAPPAPDRRSLHQLGDRAVVTDIEIPVGQNLRSNYQKAMNRATWQFALVSVAAISDPDGIRLVAGGVAAVPWRLHAAESVLAHGTLDESTIDAAAEAAAEGATPLEHNGYKLALLTGLVRRALTSLLD